MLKSWQNCMCCFFFTTLLTPHPYKHPYNPHHQAIPPLQPVFTSLFHLPTCSQNHLHNLHNSFLYNSFIFHLLIFTYSHPYNPQQKSFPLPQPFSRFMQWQGPSEEGSIVRTDTVIIFPCFPKAMKQHSQSLFLCCSNKEYWSITGCTIW